LEHGNTAIEALADNDDAEKLVSNFQGWSQAIEMPLARRRIATAAATYPMLCK
jgi:hypothetical protein